MLKLLSEIKVQDITLIDEVIDPPGYPWWMWSLSVLLLVITAVIGLMLYKKLGKPKVAEKNALKHTQQEINSISPEVSTPEFAVAVSTSIRSFLRVKTNDPSLFQTHEEFSSSSLLQLTCSEHSKNSLSEFLTSLNQLKYSKAEHQCDAHLIKSKALDMVAQLDMELRMVTPPALPTQS